MIVYEYKTGYCDETRSWAEFLQPYSSQGWTYSQRTRHKHLPGWTVTFKKPKGAQK